MLKQGSLEDQTNKRPMSSFLESPSRKLTTKLKNGNNQLKFGQKKNRNQEGSIVGNDALDLYNPKIQSRGNSNRNLLMKQQSPPYKKNYKLNSKKYKNSNRKLSKGGSISSRGAESDPEIVYRVDLGDR